MSVPSVAFGVIFASMLFIAIVATSLRSRVPIDYMGKCRRHRYDGPTPCLMCRRKCVG